MTKNLVIVTLALGLTACATSQAPLDDAYYWPDKKVTEQPVTDNPSPVTDKIEYLNIQDTTVTIRVNK